MTDLKIGMFTRYNGEISKLVEIDNTIFSSPICRLETFCEIRYLPLDSLEKCKASFNIIDLIEVGDVIVGKDGHKFEVYAVGSDCVYINGLKEFILVDEIKAIVTKDEFENISYRIGDENNE